MLKIIFAVVGGIAVWAGMGHYLPFTNSTALVVTILSTWGLISYKAIAGFMFAGAIVKI